MVTEPRALHLFRPPRRTLPGPMADPTTETVDRLARSDVVSVRPDAPVGEAARLMADRNVGDVLVVEDGALRGVVTDRDLAVRLLAEGSEYGVTESGADAAPAVRDVMTADPVSVEPSAPLQRVLGRMRDAGVRRMPVVDAGEVVGIVTFDDLVVHLAGAATGVAAQIETLAGVVQAGTPVE